MDAADLVAAIAMAVDANPLHAGHVQEADRTKASPDGTVTVFCSCGVSLQVRYIQATPPGTSQLTLEETPTPPLRPRRRREEDGHGS